MGLLGALNLGSRGSRYNSLPLHQDDATRHRDWHNVEKHSARESFDSISDSSSSTSSRITSGSSRNTSGSHQSNIPMIKQRVSALARSREIRYHLPTRMVQKFCFFMIAVLVGFVLFLIRMSYVSQRHLAEQHRPEPRPQWESFEFLKRYYGGIRTLVPLAENSPEYPLTEELLLSNGTMVGTEVSPRDVPASNIFRAYPDYKSEAYLRDYAPVNECFLDAKQTIRIPPLQYYDGRPNGFPNNVMGSYEVLDLPENICFERYGRLGPYGHGYGLHLGGTGTGQFGDKEGAEAVWSDIHEVDYRKVDWGGAQKRCYNANAARFSKHDKKEASSALLADYVLTERALNESQPAASSNDADSNKQTLPRTAVVVRMWDDYRYFEEDILTLRALIAELSLGSGGEYDVHLLVQVHNQTAPIWADKAVYDAHLRRSVPEEFWGIATLWSESQSLLLYPGLEETWARGPGLPVHGVYRGSNMALQNFAMNHPEYDFFWNWEIDTRYSGHFYHLLSKLGAWTKAQPRKLLWERNARFYIPSVHGSWEDFMHMVRVQTDSGTDSVNNIWSSIDRSGPVKDTPSGDRPIWGPERPKNPRDWFEIEGDPVPPTTFSQDKHEWGVGEDADLITLNPMFDPEGTTWGLAQDITGYNKTSEDGTDAGFAPRRAVITNVARLSKKLLTTMHRETAIGHHHAFTEMWPTTVALQHGYKAVYAPHPMYVDRNWPVGYLAATMNGGRNGATGGSRMSPFGDREHNFKGMTWYYNTEFAPKLWKRWLGLKVDGTGGEKYEMDGPEGGAGGEGRMCIPPMLLHPVKEVEIPVEGMALGLEEAEFGPSD